MWPVRFLRAGENNVTRSAVGQATHPDPRSQEMPTADTNISSLLDETSVTVGLSGGDKGDVINRLVDLLHGNGRVDDLAKLRAAVHDRENRMSTGVGFGLALPHARTDAVNDTVAAFAVTREAAEFEAPDDEPVRLVFLLAGPRADMSRHVRILSRISRLMQQERLRSRLYAADTVDEILASFEEAEMALLAG